MSARAFPRSESAFGFEPQAFDEPGCRRYLESKIADTTGISPRRRSTGPRVRLLIALLSVSLSVALTASALGQLLTEFSIPGTPTRSSITFGPDGNLWFTEGDRGKPGKIGRLTTVGVITEFPVSGRPVGGGEPSSFAQVHAITVGPDGNIWFTESPGTDYGPAFIGKITMDGVVTEFVLNTGSLPRAITTGPDGALWFTDTLYIGRITTTGQITRFRPSNGYCSWNDITAGPDGALWFIGSQGLCNAIGRITTAGTASVYATPTGAELGRTITAGPDGALWFVTSNYNPAFTWSLWRITTQGVISQVATLDNEPGVYTGIAFDPYGELWFVTAIYGDGGKIGRLTSAGLVTRFPISAIPLGNFALSLDGDVWFSAYPGKIGRFCVGALCRMFLGRPTADGRHPRAISPRR